MKTINFVIDGKTVPVNVKERLGLDDSYYFVNEVVDNLLSDDSEDVIFAWRDYNIKSATIKYYTDFEVPESPVDEYNLIYANKLYEQIVESDGFDINHHKTLLCAIDKQVDFEIQRILRKSKLDDLIDKLMDFLNGLEKEVNLSDVAKVLPELAKMGNLDEDKIVSAVLNANKKKGTRSNKKKAE